MSKPLPIVVSAQDAIDAMSHNEQHVRLLHHYYPDLQIIWKEGVPLYFTTAVNTTANGVDFIEDSQSGNWKVFYALPYKDIDVSCPKCSDPIKVGTHACRFILLVKQFGDYSISSDNILMCSSFEEQMKRCKISKYVIAKSRMHVISLLKKEKLSEYHDVVIPDSIRKLMVFS